MSEFNNFLMEKKMRLLEQYEEALDYNRIFQAKRLKTKLAFIDELLGEVE